MWGYWSLEEAGTSYGEKDFVSTNKTGKKIGKT